MFQSPRSGKFVSNWVTNDHTDQCQMAFQSPRSGKFVSDKFMMMKALQFIICFNPLDRGNLYQIIEYYYQA